MSLFASGDRVGLAERLPGGMNPVGTVVGFDAADVVVLWDTGLQVPLAPWNLAHVSVEDDPAR